jgi:lantibiotic modifying enzyme
MSKSFHDIIESEVKQIASILLNLDEKNLRFGLYEGISGISLFMYLYYKHTNNILYKRKLDKLLKQSIKSIENSKSEGLFSVGLTGWGWLIIYLENESFLEQSNSLLETIDELLHRELIRLIEQREYDLLNGALGIGLYFLKRKKPEYIEILISFFERFIDNDLLKIKRRMHRTNEDVIDFGLAHGYAGIVYFFSKCIKEKKQVVRSQKVIKATIDFMLKIFKT